MLSRLTQTILGIIVIGFMVSACSLPGSSSNNTSDHIKYANLYRGHA